MFAAPGWGAARLLPSVVSEMLTPGPEGSKKTYCAPAGDAIYQLTLHKCATSPMGERGSKNASYERCRSLVTSRDETFQFDTKAGRGGPHRPTARWETYNKRGVFYLLMRIGAANRANQARKAFRAAADKDRRSVTDCY